MSRFEQEREQLWQSIDRLMEERTLAATREAREMLRAWVLAHPEDVTSRDAGEELAMMEEALEIIAAEEAEKSEPLLTGRSG